MKKIRVYTKDGNVYEDNVGEFGTNTFCLSFVAVTRDNAHDINALFIPYSEILRIEQIVNTEEEK